jgi:hypothetical protein
MKKKIPTMSTFVLLFPLDCNANPLLPTLLYFFDVNKRMWMPQQLTFTQNSFRFNYTSP